jgi:hypothetical protein
MVLLFIHFISSKPTVFILRFVFVILVISSSLCVVFIARFQRYPILLHLFSHRFCLGVFPCVKSSICLDNVLFYFLLPSNVHLSIRSSVCVSLVFLLSVISWNDITMYIFHHSGYHPLYSFLRIIMIHFSSFFLLSF